MGAEKGLKCCMSNVLERFRKTSEMEFYNNAQKLLHELRTFLMNENNVPKRQRYIYTYPIINLAQLMLDTCMKANSIYAYTPENVLKRKQLFQQSLEMLDPLYLRLQSAINDLWRLDFGAVDTSSKAYERKCKVEKALERIGDLMVKQEELLSGCKRATKLLNRAPPNGKAK